jgi:hypothetical protein
MTRKSAATTAAPAVDPDDRQPVTHITCPFELPQQGGEYVLEAGARTPEPVHQPEEAETPVQPPVKEA